MRNDRVQQYKYKRSKINLRIFSMMLAVCILLSMTGIVLAAEPPYDKAASASSQLAAAEVTQYGMLPIYGRDVVDGTYAIEVRSSSSMFRVVAAEITVKGDEMTADITLSGDGYEKLFIGKGQEAADSDMSAFIDYVVGDDGLFTFTVPVKALNDAIPCAAFSTRKAQWYDRMILFDASTLPEDALLVDLPDYDAIESAMRRVQSGQSTGGSLIVMTQLDGEKDIDGSDTASDDENGGTTDSSGDGAGTQNFWSADAMDIDMEDGEYAIDVAIAGGSGKATVSSPTVLIVKDGKAYARLVWSSSNYDYMIVGNDKYLDLKAGEGNSTFEIPIFVMDREMTVIGDTTAMGTPHEVEYTLTFYGETIGPKSQMPQEAAKRVVIVAVIVIIAGAVLNHYVQKKRRA